MSAENREAKPIKKTTAPHLVAERCTIVVVEVERVFKKRYLVDSSLQNKCVGDGKDKRNYGKMQHTNTVSHLTSNARFAASIHTLASIQTHRSDG